MVDGMILETCIKRLEEAIKRLIQSSVGRSCKIEEAIRKICYYKGWFPTPEEFAHLGLEDIENLQSYTPLHRDMIVLDYGSGIGRITKPMAKLVRVVYALDTDEEMLRVGKIYCSEATNIKWIQCADEILFSSIDFIYCILVFQHNTLSGSQRILEDIFRVLKVHGKAVLQFPVPETHRYYYDYTEENVTKLLSCFKIISVRTVVKDNVDNTLAYRNYLVEKV